MKSSHVGDTGKGDSVVLLEIIDNGTMLVEVLGPEGAGLSIPGSNVVLRVSFDPGLGFSQGLSVGFGTLVGDNLTVDAESELVDGSEARKGIHLGEE